MKTEDENKLILIYSKVSGGGANVQRIKDIILQSNPLLEVRNMRRKILPLVLFTGFWECKNNS
jgi:hypothetical protein